MLQSSTNNGSGLNPAQDSTRRTVLYDWHCRLTDKCHIAPFAGYLMPLWYTSISGEHKSVREAAGVFDCTHMGVLGISGPGAAEFTDLLTTNSIVNLQAGRARYSFVLDSYGAVLDDIIVYRRDIEDFFLVVNAANHVKIKNWIGAVLGGEVCIDSENAGRTISAKPQLRDLRDGDCEGNYMVEIALQGPKSLDVLSLLIRDDEARTQIADLRPFAFAEIEIEDNACLVSRTGYTGARYGFELFAHPEKVPRLWEAVLDAGQPLGLLPCGLGSRDSLRIEAGLPLYGHELAGEYNISPFEAGYGWAVKFEKEFFVGKKAMERISEEYVMKVARIELPGTKGIRPVRQNDSLLDEQGRCVGWVLSCARVGETQIALGYVDRAVLKEGEPVGLYYTARSNSQVRQGRRENTRKGEHLERDLAGTVLDRFAKF